MSVECSNARPSRIAATRWPAPAAEARGGWRRPRQGIHGDCPATRLTPSRRQADERDTSCRISCQWRQGDASTLLARMDYLQLTRRARARRKPCQTAHAPAGHWPPRAPVRRPKTREEANAYSTLSTVRTGIALLRTCPTRIHSTAQGKGWARRRLWRYYVD